MIATLKDGTTLKLRPGAPTMGLRIVSVTISAADVADPQFFEWFHVAVYTRFEPCMAASGRYVEVLP